LVAFLLPAVIVGATVFLTRFFGAPAGGELGPWYGIFTVVLFQTFFPLVGAMGEELGWRGYALPRMQATRSALSASLILGVITAAWHLPLFVTGIWGQPIPHILFIIAFSVVIAWLFNKANGSVLLAMLYHGAFNGILEFLFPIIGLSNLDLLWWMLAGVTSIAAAGVFLLSGRELGRVNAPPVQVMPVEGVSV
jgi:membrane protease YdiL (CAAX protease family)